MKKLLLNPRHDAAMEETVDFDIERVKGAEKILFCEGLFFSRITEPGKNMVANHAISKLAKAIIPFLLESTTKDF
ncbi:hypothetical protein [Methanobrevibacter sp.]|uniref:hypothetical protein n=1 Tax=Methanobrevibacter sp. TaxID=66852 RepID=UPI00388F1FBA